MFYTPHESISPQKIKLWNLWEYKPNIKILMRCISNDWNSGSGNIFTQVIHFDIYFSGLINLYFIKNLTKPKSIMNSRGSWSFRYVSKSKELYWGLTIKFAKRKDIFMRYKPFLACVVYVMLIFKFYIFKIFNISHYHILFIFFSMVWKYWIWLPLYIKFMIVK